MQNDGRIGNLVNFSKCIFGRKSLLHWAKRSLMTLQMMAAELNIIRRRFGIFYVNVWARRSLLSLFRRVLWMNKNKESKQKGVLWAAFLHVCCNNEHSIKCTVPGDKSWGFQIRWDKMLELAVDYKVINKTENVLFVKTLTNSKIMLII